jgi:hypothetical protein
MVSELVILTFIVFCLLLRRSIALRGLLATALCFVFGGVASCQWFFVRLIVVWVFCERREMRQVVAVCFYYFVRTVYTVPRGIVQCRYYTYSYPSEMFPSQV